MNPVYYSLITGASEGFGKALALECASRGMNLALVALPGSGLPALAAFIQKNFPVKVCIFEKDLTQESQCYDLQLEVELAGLHIRVLINNAGIGNTAIFDSVNPEFFQKQIRLNVTATTMLTSLFLPALKNNAPSHVLNIGSLCSFFYLPKKQVYGATKSFVYFFSKTLARELRREKVRVSVACPGGMNTNFNVSLLNRNGNFFSRISILEPESAATTIVTKMLAGKEVIIPGRINRLSLWIDRLLPAFLKETLTNRLMRNLNSPVPIASRSTNRSPVAA